MYAASTAAARRTCADADCAVGWPCLSVCAFLLSLLTGIALSFLRKYDDYRSKSSMIVVQ
jgi:hypothetical protein